MHIVKRRGHTQAFDGRKVYASVYAACLNAHVTEEESENIASNVAKEINEWVKDKETLTSAELFQQISKELNRLNKDAALMYSTHRDLS